MVRWCSILPGKQVVRVRLLPGPRVSSLPGLKVSSLEGNMRKSWFVGPSDYGLTLVGDKPFTFYEKSIHSMRISEQLQTRFFL